MTIRTRKLAAVLSAGALLGGAGAGLADAAKSGSSNGTRSAQQSGRPDGKRGGPLSSATLAKIASALGVSSADLKAALEANRPAKPSGDGAKGGFAADLATALGVEESAVQAILDANKPAGKPAKGSRPDQSALVTALASGLSLDEATVTSALESLHGKHDRRGPGTELYATIATALGKTAAEVQAAFEANRPAAPTS